MKNTEYKLMSEIEDKHWYYKGLHDLILKTIEKFYIRGSGLDAGCGTGGLLKKLYYAIGVDFSEEAVDVCKQKGLNVRCRNLNNTSYLPNQFDYITCIDVLYHQEINDLYVLQLFYESLEPRGYLILNLPAFNCLKREHDVLVGGSRRYNTNLCQGLENIGFKIKMISYRLPLGFIAIMIKKIFKITGHDMNIGKFNNILYKLNKIENWLILKGVKIPFGSSLFIVCQK